MLAELKCGFRGGGGGFTLYADHDYGRRERHKCNRGRKKGSAKDGGVGLKSGRKEYRCGATRSKMGKRKARKVRRGGSSRTGGGGASLLQGVGGLAVHGEGDR